MQKIMFSDVFGLTKAVLEGRKTMTRRAVLKSVITEAYKKVSEATRDKDVDDETLDRMTDEFVLARSPFRVGEIVAVAQNLKDMGYDARDTKTINGAIWGLDHTPAWTNKMFVCASMCVHHIRITDVRIERIQEISDEDCLKEGIIEGDAEPKLYGFKNGKHYDSFFSPREAFAALIDIISGKDTWESNPYVFVYEFELVK